jgi:hypothetical protein
VLAELDSRPLPPFPLLVAEVDGQVRAALSLDDGKAIADPFHATRDLLDLLRAHATALPRPSHGLLTRLRLRPRSV